MKRIGIFHMLPSGGGIRVLGQFAEGLQNSFQVSIYLPRGGSTLHGRGKPPEKLVPYPMWRKPTGILRPFAPVFLPLRLLAFRSVCRKTAEIMNREVEVALIHNTMPVAAPPILQYLSVPSAYFCYEYPRHIYEKDIISRTGRSAVDLALGPLEIIEKRMDRKSVIAADGILTFSRYMRNSVKKIYGRDSSIVRPGIDSVFFSPEPTGVRGEFVLSVGALWPFKGHETAIRILGRLPAEIRPPLIIVGDREFLSYSAKLHETAAAEQVEITVMKKVSNIELRNLYRKAKAVLCCQRREPYGLVPLEAMACKTPVLAVSEGGFTDNVVHGETGLLFDGSVGAGTSELAAILKGGSAIGEITERGLEFVRNLRTVETGVENLAEKLRRL